MAEALRLDRFHAVNAGRRDLAAGPDFLFAEGAPGAGVPWISANLLLADGRRPCPRYRILGIGPLRLGIIGLTDDEGSTGEGFRVEAAESALDAVLGEMGSRCDLVLVLSDLGYRRDLRLPVGRSRIDMVLGSHGSKQLKWPMRVERSAVYSLGTHGRYVGFFRFLLSRPGRSRGLMTEAEHGKIGTALELVGVKGGLDERGRPDLSVFRDLARGRHGEKLAREVPDFVATHVPWTAHYVGVCSVADDPRVARIVEEDKIRTGELMRPHLDRPGAGTGGFRGAVACSACHVREATWWRATAHAAAFEKLRAKRRSWDPECFPCHVTGFVSRGGATPQGLGGLEGVQCEACHGAGSGHERYAAAPREELEAACLRCHRGEFAASFRLDRDFNRVACSRAKEEGGRTP